MSDAEAEFNKVVKADMVVAEDGKLTPYEGAFVTGYEKTSRKTDIHTCLFVKLKVRLSM